MRQHCYGRVQVARERWRTLVLVRLISVVALRLRCRPMTVCIIASIAFSSAVFVSGVSHTALRSWLVGNCRVAIVSTVVSLVVVNVIEIVFVAAIGRLLSPPLPRYFFIALE
jgi:hypothetical protein